MSTSNETPLRIELPASHTTIMRVMWATVLLLAVTGAITGLYPAESTDHPIRWHFHRLFFLDFDKSIPTWVSSFGLSSAAVLLASIARQRSRAELRFARHWWVLAAGFAFMSVDESVELHEYFGLPGASSVIALDWLSFGVPLIIFMGVAFTQFLRGLPRGIRHALVAAGVVYLSGAIVSEIVGSLIVGAGLKSSVYYQFVVVVEETLEMSGITLLVGALLKHGSTVVPSRSVGDATVTELSAPDRLVPEKA